MRVGLAGFSLLLLDACVGLGRTFSEACVGASGPSRSHTTLQLPPRPSKPNPALTLSPSAAGEHWDQTEQMDTYYNPIPHFGYDLALKHSPQVCVGGWNGAAVTGDTGCPGVGVAGSAAVTGYCMALGVPGASSCVAPTASWH